MLPQYIIAGASKTGSTWLVRCFDEHPEVFAPLITPEYFSTNFDKGQDWYESLYAQPGDAKVLVDKSTSYIVDPEAPARMHACAPDAHLIFMLRDPIERANSHYNMWLRGGRADENIDEVLVAGHELVEEGLYFKQISRFLAFYPADRVTILLYDDLKADAHAFARTVFELIGVDADFVPEMIDKRFHQTKTRPKFQKPYVAAVKTMRWINKRSRLVESVIDGLRRRRAFDFIHKINQGAAFPKMSDATRKRLSQYYRADIDQLAAHIGRDLSHWAPPTPKAKAQTPEPQSPATDPSPAGA